MILTKKIIIINYLKIYEIMHYEIFMNLFIYIYDDIYLCNH